MNPEKRHKLESLLLLSLEGQATDEQMSLLNEMIDADVDAQSYCVHFLSVVSCLRSDPRISDIALREVSASPEFDASLWEALAENEKTALAVKIDKPIEADSAFSDESDAVAHRRPISKISLYAFMISSAALLFILLLVIVKPAKPPVVAVLFQSLDAKWGESEQSLEDGSLIRQGDLTLLEGLADIRFYSDVEMLIEGPAKIRFESSGQVFLSYGKLSSRVPKSAIGFTVRTPDAVVVDYGTEFGMFVRRDGMTETHVFEGEVEMRAGSNPLVFEQSSRVTEGQAKLLDSETGQIQNIEVHGRTFARRLFSDNDFVWHGENFDLADAVGGGNGFGSGRLGCGINVNSGQLFTYNDLLSQGWTIEGTSIVPFTSSFPSSGQYRPVVSNVYVDGVFVPDGGRSRCVVSTGDHLFESCPDTSGNYYIGVINSGNLLKDLFSGSTVNLYRLHEMTLSGQSYGTRRNPGIFVHSNMGITFDLDAIRSALPGITVSGFKSLCGISDMETTANTADFWVLVDGVKRFESIGMSKPSGSKQIEIPLTDEDRFLTLAATEGDGAIGSDWCIFAMPALVLESE